MKCRVMGIVNVTPDSFSDGGKYFSPDEAVRRAVNLSEEGADIVDLGGESTRPGATAIDWQTEWGRIEPVLGRLVGILKGRCVMSVDTYHPETAERSLAAGAGVINCVSAKSVPAMLDMVAEREGAELVMPFRPGDVLSPRACAMRERLYLDPMIGFGTTREEDLALLRSLPELVRTGRVLVGASRKRIVKALTGEKVLGKNLGGNLAIAVWCALNGASAVRVHDVRETVQALSVFSVIAPSLKE